MPYLQSVERTKISTRMMAGRAFLIKTPICANYLKVISNWLTTGSHGGLVYGQPRLGKTSATRWALKMLVELIGNFPLIEVPVRNQNIASEKAFFQHILHCVRHRHYMVGSAGDKRDALNEWLVTRAKRATINAAVIFFDEAQFLKNEHYKWLLNISNELDINGCRLFCLLVGQPELEEVKTNFIETGKEQIVGRFMARELEFTGISAQEDLISALIEFHNTIYPIENNILFAENFIPQAINSGFKLNALGPAMWSAFETLWIASGVSGSVVVPMHYFTAALIGTLNTLVDSDGEFLDIQQSIVMDAVKASGFRESLKIRKILEMNRSGK
ncbi:MAG: ATP-binding protein [Methylotenera sp.]|jgi:type II secretory pathway predicted ATPase ExeA|nr:ATP-binding protein [Methylotenera sp.]